MRPYLKDHPNGVYLQIKLQPRASRNEIVGTLEAELKVKVTAPPVDCAANDALIELLAERLACAKSALQIVRGQTSRHKVIFIQGQTVEKIEARLPGS